jgi:hypothetical protein
MPTNQILTFSSFMMDDELIKKRKALVQTIAFFDIFDFALTHRRLCAYALYEKWTPNELRTLIDNEEFLISVNDRVFLRGRAHIIKIAEEKDICANKLIEKAKKYVKYMQMLPFVRMVGICNGLSFYNVEKNSDIDLFIIAEKKRLFLARTFSLILTTVLGIRRSGDKVKGRLCLSFLISRDQMDLGYLQIKDDIYFKFWILLIRPLIGQDTYREFISENKWIKQYFDYEIDQKKHLLPQSKRLSKIQKILEWPLKGKFGDIIEHVLRKWQTSRAEAKANKLEKRDGIVITDSILKFHDNDIRKKVSTIWKKRVGQFQKYLISSSQPDSQPDFDIQDSDRSHRSHIASGSHSRDNVYTKNEAHLLDSQKTQIQAD